MAAMRKRMQEGSRDAAAKSPISSASAPAGRRMSEAHNQLIDKILEHRHDPSP